MAIRALLYSKSPDPAQSLSAVFKELGICAEICSDIFSAIKKGTQQNYSCLIVDWSDQPESNFLLKRARDSEANRDTVAVAIVDKQPVPGQLCENRVDFLLYRPIATNEARAVLAKACQEKESATSGTEAGSPAQQNDTPEESTQPELPNPVLTNPVSTPADAPLPHVRTLQEALQRLKPEESHLGNGPSDDASDAPTDDASDAPTDAASDPPTDEPTIGEPERSRPAIGFRTVCAAVLVIGAVFCMWHSRQTVLYLAHTREGVFSVLRESIAALLYGDGSGARAADSVGTDQQQDAYFARTNEKTHGDSKLRLAWADVSLPEGAVRLPKPFDFPLPTPGLMRSDPPPMHVRHAPVPDSLRGSAPIGPPIVATAGPAQIMPVSTPMPQIPQISEPVRLSEEAARAMLVHSVDPVYPPDAVAQKLQGPVLLQAMIGRDGSVQDVKIVRGYFVLGRAAIAAVKTWQFQPYSVNGHPTEMQTILTVNFSRPQN